MSDRNHDTSDAATGLPPLNQVVAEEALLVMAWDASHGMVYNPATDTTPAVRILHLRGVTSGGEHELEWAQVHIAVPVEHAVDVAAALAAGTTDFGGTGGDVTTRTQALHLRREHYPRVARELRESATIMEAGPAVAYRKAADLIELAGRMLVRATCPGVWHITTPREAICPLCGEEGPQTQ